MELLEAARESHDWSSELDSERQKHIKKLAAFRIRDWKRPNAGLKPVSALHPIYFGFPTEVHIPIRTTLPLAGKILVKAQYRCPNVAPWQHYADSIGAYRSTLEA